MTSHIEKPITLKNGLTLPNRLVKAAMAENLADGDLLPTDQVYIAYKTWANGGWGMLITGILRAINGSIGC
jgi:2,4-dienoyl-CoA reductase-like NADH-dependent reductase (Old Yellow Enzyme family)